MRLVYQFAAISYDNIFKEAQSGQRRPCFAIRLTACLKSKVDKYQDWSAQATVVHWRACKRKGEYKQTHFNNTKC